MKKLLVALAAFGLVLMLIVGASLMPPTRACPAIGSGQDSPPGWTWEQDVYNGCAYTLFNDQGERASSAIYDELQLESPNPMLLYPPRLLGVVATALAIAGLVALLRRTRREPESGAPVSSTSARES